MKISTLKVPGVAFSGFWFFLSERAPDFVNWARKSACEKFQNRSPEFFQKSHFNFSLCQITLNLKIQYHFLRKPCDIILNLFLQVNKLVEARRLSISDFQIFDKVALFYLWRTMVAKLIVILICDFSVFGLP